MSSEDGLDIAVKFVDPTWISIGRLLTPRYGHRSISYDQSTIIHIGGYGDK